MLESCIIVFVRLNFAHAERPNCFIVLLLQMDVISVPCCFYCVLYYVHQSEHSAEPGLSS